MFSFDVDHNLVGQKRQLSRQSVRLLFSRRVVATVLLSGILVGCGSDNNTTPVTPTPTTALAAPGAPATTATSNAVSVSWTAVTGATSYELHRSADNNSATATKLAPTTPISATSFNDFGLNGSTAYYYWVKACNATGCSAFGENTTVTTPAIVDELVWSDEFAGSALSDQNWDIQMGNGCPGLCGWGNRELQFYSDSAENLRVRDGNLEIVATDSGSGAQRYGSARIRTAGKQSFRYAEGKTMRIEARMQLPGTQGMWPAFWMLPEGEVYGGWPLSGEIDIMEAVNLGKDGNTETSWATHYGIHPSIWTFVSDKIDNELPPQSNFQVYAIEWSQGLIRWYVNDRHVHTQSGDLWYALAGQDERHEILQGGAPFIHDFHILLNIAVGGNFPDPPDATTRFPQTMLVDYVRVYNCADPGTAGSICHNVNPGIKANYISLRGSALRAAPPIVDTVDIYGDGLETHTEGSRSTTFVSQTTGQGVAVDADARDGSDRVMQVTFTGADSSVSLVAPVAQDSDTNAVFYFGGGDIAGQIEFDLKVDSVAAGSSIEIRITDTKGASLSRSYTAAQLMQIKDMPGSAQRQYADFNEMSVAGGSFLYTSVDRLFSVLSTGSFAASAQTVIQIDDISIRVPCSKPQSQSNCGAGLSSTDSRVSATVHPSVSFVMAENAGGLPNSVDIYTDRINTASGFAMLGGVALPGVNGDESVMVSEETLDDAHSQVIQCNAHQPRVVCGLVPAMGSTVDWSAFKLAGVLEFDLRITQKPPVATEIRFKFESEGQNRVDLVLGDTATFTTSGTWRRVSIDLSHSVWAAYDFGKVNALYFLPTWTAAQGTIWQVDNITLYRP